MLKKIVSGGQTGADRAALDFAIQRAIPHGGFVPKGRKAEDGPIPSRYRVKETRTASYPQRTEQNVIHSDGTLIISHGSLTEGSANTQAMAVKHDRPWLHLDMKRLTVREATQMLRSWVAENHIEVLNVAGPRKSRDPLIYDTTFEILQATFS
ncbi:MAG TPA: putative molybdenum carrier protein [Syntrophorhabdales bacterium]|nr:putative molybdenum carrier protein [Syntrophorhabdales bacterium]